MADEELQDREARIDKLAHELAEAMDVWHTAVELGGADIADDLFDAAAALAHVRDGLRRERGKVAMLQEEASLKVAARSFTFTDEDVFDALEHESTAWDIVRYLRRRAELKRGPITRSQVSRASWALRRLASDGRVTQEQVTAYGRRCASVWRKVGNDA
jgi:hypothetical protein